jgi:hypothetical protein
MTSAEKSSVCPLCGGPNACAVFAGDDPASCWCMDVVMADELVARIPEAARDKACVCATCARAASRSARPLRTVVR